MLLSPQGYSQRVELGLDPWNSAQDHSASKRLSPGRSTVITAFAQQAARQDIAEHKSVVLRSFHWLAQHIIGSFQTRWPLLTSTVPRLRNGTEEASSERHFRFGVFTKSRSFGKGHAKHTPQSVSAHGRILAEHCAGQISAKSA